MTRRGWGVLVSAGGLLVLARLFGSAELAGLGAAAGLAVAAAAVVVGRAPVSYRGERWLAPTRVGVGGFAEARLRFTNSGPRPTTVSAVALDAIFPETPGPRPHRSGGTAAAGCLVPPLLPGGMAEARYDLPTGRRGVVTVGPLVVSLGDPLGLAERRLPVAEPVRLVVHPRIHPVLALPGSSTREARLGSTRPARAPRSDDFFALREYEVGDDLRRVHWRSTARLGELMLRQDELRNGSVATVLLDTRAGAHRDGSFERALEVAASIAAALYEDGRRLRFLTSGGFDVHIDGRPGRAQGSQADGRWATLLEHLALVTPDAGGPDRMAGAVGTIRRAPSGPLVAVVADATPAEQAALEALRPRLGLVLIARCLSASPPGPQRAGTPVVIIDSIESFPDAWNQAVRTCGRCDPVRR